MNFFRIRLKVLLPIFLLSCIFCSGKKDDDLFESLLIIWMAYQAHMYDMAYDSDKCIEISRPNGLYFTGDYYFRFHGDQRQYTNVVIGDSTMDISSRYPNFLSEKSQSVAVSGNRLCDMVIQTPAINTANPKNIVISTPGGNDLLQQADQAYIFTYIDFLVDKLRSRYPEAKISVVSIHPTLLSYGNQHKAPINDHAKNKIESIGGCFLDTLSLFGVSEGEPAPSDKIVDSIHYNQTMSFMIKDNLKTVCGVDL